MGAFFSHPARIALAIVTFVLAAVALFSGGTLSPGVREDRANRWVLVAFLALGLLAGYPAGLHGSDGTLDARRGHGAVARRRALRCRRVLRIWPVFVLGRRFSGLVAIQPGHTLVTTGIYRVIRHPVIWGCS